MSSTLTSSDVSNGVADQERIGRPEWIIAGSSPAAS